MHEKNGKWISLRPRRDLYPECTEPIQVSDKSTKRQRKIHCWLNTGEPAEARGRTDARGARGLHGGGGEARCSAPFEWCHWRCCPQAIDRGMLGGSSHYAIMQGVYTAGGRPQYILGLVCRCRAETATVNNWNSDVGDQLKVYLNENIRAVSMMAGHKIEGIVNWRGFRLQGPL